MIKSENTIQLLKEKGQEDTSNDVQNTAQKNAHWATSLKTGINSVAPGG
jgi:hypothetical protein